MQYQHLQPSKKQLHTQTPDQINKFKVSELIKDMPKLQSLSNQQLANYCHNQWKEWIKTVVELKNLKNGNQEQAKINQIPRKECDAPSIKPVQKKNNQNLYSGFPQPPSINPQTIPQQTYYPPYMQPSYNEMLRHQQQNMAYLSAQNQNRPQFGFNLPTIDRGSSSFPFPSFNPEMSKMVFNPTVGYSNNVNQMNSKDRMMNQGHNNGP